MGTPSLGLWCSQTSADALQKAGAQALAGDIVDCESLRQGVSKADGVIHLAFNYDYSQNEKSVADERNAVAAMADAMSGSGRPLVITSATAMAASVGGGPSTEEGPFSSIRRSGIETLAKDLVTTGRTSQSCACRRSHDTRKSRASPPDLWPMPAKRALRPLSVMANADGRRPMSAIRPVLYRLAFERGEPGPRSIMPWPRRASDCGAIAEAHANGLGRAGTQHPRWRRPRSTLGWIAPFATLRPPLLSSALTQQKARLETDGTRPAGRFLLRMDYGSV